MVTRREIRFVEAFHEPSHGARAARPREPSLTNARAGRPRSNPLPFMVPMREFIFVEAIHEPRLFIHTHTRTLTPTLKTREQSKSRSKSTSMRQNAERPTLNVERSKLDVGRWTFRPVHGSETAAVFTGLQRS